MRYLTIILICLVVMGNHVTSINAQEQAACADAQAYNFRGVWSPDGTKILYMGYCERAYDLWVMNANGSNPVNLTLANATTTRFIDALTNMNPSWSPDGEYIAYVSNITGNDDIWIMQADGQMPVNLTASNEGRDWKPRWSPNGQFIAYIAEDINRVDSFITIINHANQELTRLTTETHRLYRDFDWSPDSTQIAYSVNIVDAGVNDWEEITITDYFTQIQPAGTRIRAMDGSPEISITEAVDDFLVEWSPDGSQLAIARLEGLNRNILLATSDGRRIQNLTANFQWSFAPNWSSDGEWLAFYVAMDGYSNIWIANPKENEFVALTEGTAYHAWPRWSPDGTKILFESDKSGRMDVWIMNADGSNQVNLTASK